MSALQNRVRKLEGNRPLDPSAVNRRLFKAMASIGTPQREVDAVFRSAGATDIDLCVLFVSMEAGMAPHVVS